MTFIWLFISSKSDKVSVPFPDGHWILCKEALREYLRQIRLISILFALGPKGLTIRTSEGWDTTGGTDSRTGQDSDFLASNHYLRSLLGCLLLRLINILVHLFKSAAKQILHVLHEFRINVCKLLFHLLDLKL